MRIKLTVLVVACLILGAMGDIGVAQESNAIRKEAEGQPQMQMGPGMMHQMMGKDNPMMEQWHTMMRTMISPDSPNSILTLKTELGLSEEQVEKIKTIGEKANAEAKKTLSEKQLKQFETLTKNWMPQTMMQGMKKMHCPMMQMMQEQ